jgi:hypothetical protein
MLGAAQFVAGRYHCFRTYVALLATATRAALATRTQVTMLMEMVWRIETVLVYTRVGCALLAEGLLNNLQLFRHDGLQPTSFARRVEFVKKRFHTITRPPLNVLTRTFVNKCFGKTSPDIPLHETIANKDIPKKDIPLIVSVWDATANTDKQS